MLPKKKRWAAAIHTSSTTCPPVAPPGLAAAPSPNRNQWNTTHSPNPNTTSRPLQRHQTPPSSTISLSQPISVSSIYQTAGPPIISGSASFIAGGNSAAGRLVNMETVQPGSKQPSSFPLIRQPNEVNVTNPAPVSRGDFPASIITAITNNPTDLFQQQSELLLQILPQEYLACYAQNFAKLANTNIASNNHLKNAYDHVARGLVVTQPTLDHSITNSKSVLTEAPTHHYRQSGQSLSSPPHRSDASDFPPVSLATVAFHNTLVSNSGSSGGFTGQQQPSGQSRSKGPDNMKPTRIPTPVLRQMPTTSNPVLSNPNSSSSRFSPNRRLSGSSIDVATAHHVTKNWPQQQQVANTTTATTHAQNLVGFDLSTLSAVARTSGLISSSSGRMDPATLSLLSQWDNATQLALLSQNRDLTGLSDAGGRKISPGLLTGGGVSVSASTFASNTTANTLYSGNGFIDCSNSLSGHRIVGSPMDSKPRANSDLLTNSRVYTTTSSQKTGGDVQTLSSRYQTTSKPSTSATPGHPSDMMDRLAPMLAIPGTTDSSKAYRSNPQWLIIDNRMELPAQTSSSSVPAAQSISSNLVSREQRVTEPADTRFAILQDAKMAALNVDWPTSAGSGGGGMVLTSSSNNVANPTRGQRVRSSSSFCSTSLSPSLNNPNLAPGVCSSSTSITSSYCSSTPSIARISSSALDEIRLINVPNHSSSGVKPTSSMNPHLYTQQPQTVYLGSQSTRYPQPVNSNNNMLSNRSIHVVPPLGRTNGEYITQVKTLTTTTTPFTHPSLSDPAVMPHQKSIQPLPTGSLDSPTASIHTGRPEPGSRLNPSLPNQPQSLSVTTISTDTPKSFNSDNNTIRRSTNSYTMPLKKRLIQRYEADSVTSVETNSRWSKQIEAHADVLCVQVHSPISPASQNSPLSSFPSVVDIKPQYVAPVKTQAPASPVPSEKPRNLPGSQASETSGTKRKGGQNKSNRTKSQLTPQQSNAANTDAERRQSVTKRSNAGLISVKRGNLKGTNRSKLTTQTNTKKNANDNYARRSKSTVKLAEENCEQVNEVTPYQRRRLPVVEGTRRTRRNSSSASSATSWARVTGVKQEDSADSIPRRRMAAVNGTLLMMVAARSQRSTSSASASSCSLQSMDADDVDANHDDEVEDVVVERTNVDETLADESSHSICSSTASSSRNAAASQSSSQRRMARSCAKPMKPSTGDLSTKGGGHTRPLHTTGELTTRMKKPKRAAALAASAATAASATTVGSKRARAGSKRAPVGESKRRRLRDLSEPSPMQESNEDEDQDDGRTENEDHLVGNDYEDDEDDGDESLTMPTGGIEVASKTDMMTLDELAAALMEDKIPLDELLHHLPGPPNLANLTEHSLHPAHSLEYYKRNQTPFVQLVSCNDPGLKQVPKCRACRQLKGGAHFEATANGESSVSDDGGGGSDGTVSKQTTPMPTATTRDGQFKRPNGRNSHSEKLAETESDKSKSDRPRSRKGASRTSAALSSPTASGLSNNASPVSVFCRFWGFRKLVFNNRGLLKLADFCHSTEASPTDRSLWEMHHPVSPHLSVSAARYILERAGTLFCRLLRQELAILTGNRNRDQPVHRGPGAPPKNGLRRSAAISGGAGAASATTRICAGNAVAWKRPVKGVREMCDVCETTMFNTHWVCAKCGYSVCVHCCEEAKARQKDSPINTTDLKVANADEVGRDRNKTKHSKGRNGSMMGWSSCTTTRQHHDPERLLLTALLPASTVGRLLHRVHRIARQYRIRLGCGCLPSELEGCPPKLEKSPTAVEVDRSVSGDPRGTAENSSLDLLADLALQTGMTTVKKCEDEPNADVHRRYVTNGAESKAFLLESRNITNNLSSPESIAGLSLPPHTWIHTPAPLPTGCSPRSELKSTGISTTVSCDAFAKAPQANPKYRILQLHQPDNPATLLAFQHEWRQNRPVIVSGCQDKFDSDLWSPRSFAEEFGSLRTPLVDCATGLELTRYPLRTFWEGFERKSKRLMNKSGRALCLKLKDWPTTDDFAELQPNRFSDLMSNLPMPEYTCREGQLNLASRLASFFVCPDLGPKLYVAYGTSGSRSMGTTNLHVDIADAINILLYVGDCHPSDSQEESAGNAEAVLSVMRQSNVDRVFLERAMAWNRRVKHSIGSQLKQNPQRVDDDDDNDDGDQTGTSDFGPPGALWHIFLPEDMPALRKFLTMITEEKSGAPLEPGSDPIHDQLFYLDQPLLDRLYTCTGVLPCTIVQFRGDSVFIPAGAAHQVRNLNSCIKAAVDFVSPEHLPQCFHLIDEFRRLSSTHQNHEDKLQVKNMLFHAVKDALSVLLSSGPPPTSEPTAYKQNSDDEDSFDCKLINLFDADRLASAQLIGPSLMMKHEENGEQKPESWRLSPCRVKSDMPVLTTTSLSSFDCADSRSKQGGVATTRPTKSPSERTCYTSTAMDGDSGRSAESSPSHLSKSPVRPHSTPNSNNNTENNKLGTVASSATLPLASYNCASTGTLRYKSRSNQPIDTGQTVSNRVSLYDPHYRMDTSLQQGDGLSHRNGERDFVVSGSQLG